MFVYNKETRTILFQCEPPQNVDFTGRFAGETLGLSTKQNKNIRNTIKAKRHWIQPGAVYSSKPRLLKKEMVAI
jgi:hypothetical protein